MDGQSMGLLLNIYNGKEIDGQETKGNFPNKNHDLCLVCRPEAFFRPRIH